MLGNRPGGPSFLNGGVVIASGIAGTPPQDVDVQGNLLLGNEPDLFWDETGSVDISGNVCRTSEPALLCR